MQGLSQSESQALWFLGNTASKWVTLPLASLTTSYWQDFIHFDNSICDLVLTDHLHVKHTALTVCQQLTWDDTSRLKQEQDSQCRNTKYKQNLNSFKDLTTSVVTDCIQ